MRSFFASICDRLVIATADFAVTSNVVQSIRHRTLEILIHLSSAEESSRRASLVF